MSEDVEKIIMEELVRDITGESTDIYSLVYQSFKIEWSDVEIASQRTAEVIEDFKNRLVKRLKE